MPALIRAFVAVSVPARIADKLEYFISSLRPLAQIRWVTRAQFHITLKFLGEQSSDKINLVKSALAGLKKFEPFEIELSHAGAFPNFKHPRVLWLSGADGGRELSELARRVDSAIFEHSGIPTEERAFKAHLTLARLKGEEMNQKLLSALENVPRLKWFCDDLSLMQSKLTSRGAIYSRLI